MFPKAKRVTYSKCPLQEVICQFRFSPILEIGVSDPVRFQDVVRHVFPVYEPRVESQGSVELRGNESGGADLHASQNRVLNHYFGTPDGRWSINLTSEFIAFSTRDYGTWEGFCTRFEGPLSSFKEIYAPSFFSRIGLRYVDAIDRERLGLHGVRWADVIRPEVVGILGFDHSDERSFMASIQQNQVRVDDGISMVITTGIDQRGDGLPPLFMIDTDASFSGQLSVEAMDLGSLGRLHEESHNFFEWALTPMLKEAMGPEDQR